MGLSSRAKLGTAVAVAVAVAGGAWLLKSDNGAAPGPAVTASGGASAAAGVAPKQHPSRPAEKPLWKDLTPAQQLALGPLQPEWDTLAGVRKKKWLDIANRFAKLKPDEQARIHERMADWVKMTPEQRLQVRQNFSRAHKIDPGKKTAQWEEYQQLPEDRKKELAAKAPAKKQVVNLPTLAQSKIKRVAPIKQPNAKPDTAPVIPPATPVAAPDASAAAAAASAAASALPLPNASNVTPVPATPAPPSNDK